MLDQRRKTPVRSEESALARTDQIVDLFLRNLNTEGTKRVYRREIRMFFSVVQKPLAEIEIDDLLRFKDSLRGLKTATIARKLVIVKALLTFATEERLLARNPARRLKIPRVHQAEPKILTIAEAEAMLRSPDRRTLQGRRDHAILCVLLSVAIRESELCGLDIGDLGKKWGHMVLSVRRGKGNKPRSFGIPNAVSKVIADYLEMRGTTKPDDPLFLTLGKRGARPSRITAKAVDYLISTHARRALISKNVTPHLLRHCACSFALANGASPAEVREMAGHSSLAVTNRYVHMLETAASGAAKKSPLWR